MWIDTLLIPALLQGVIPLALLAWLAFGPQPSRVAWLLTALIVACYSVAVALAGLWLVLPWYTPVVYGALFVLALARSRRRGRAGAAWPRDRWGVAGVAARTALLALAVGLAAHALAGRRAPAGAVDLTFPMRSGTYLVLNGGSNQLLNAHLMTLAGERFRPYRGQSYGVDIVRVDARGLRARGLAPRDNAEYMIFGDSVFAPCAGRVVRAEGGVPETRPLQPDRRHIAGNYVMLACGDVWVLLGHFQRGSVQVRAGDRVAAGQWIGRVGNTGNSAEPHLHVHVQRPAAADAFLGGDPLPVRFDGRFPVRNARIRSS